MCAYTCLFLMHIKLQSILLLVFHYFVHHHTLKMHSIGEGRRGDLQINQLESEDILHDEYSLHALCCAGSTSSDIDELFSSPLHVADEFGAMEPIHSHSPGE